MKTLFDTSVLIAAMVEMHPSHPSAFLRLQEAQKRKISGFISSHSLAETYSVLTKMPLNPRISPFHAQQLIQKNIIEIFNVISLDEADYVSFLEHVSQIGVTGGAVYDALIMYAGVKEGVRRILTLNPKHFQRVYPECSELVVSPDD